MTTTHVDRRVVRSVEADWQVDELVLRRETGGSIGVALNKRDHVRRANAALEEDAGCAERATGKDDATIFGERDEAVRPKSRIVGLDTSDLGTVADDVAHKDVCPESEVRAREGGLEIGRHGACALAILELYKVDQHDPREEGNTYVEGTEAESMVFEIGVVIDRDLRVALALQQLRDNSLRLLEVPLAVGRGVVGAGKSCYKSVRERLVVRPGTRPASGSREVSRVRKPVETAGA